MTRNRTLQQAQITLANVSQQLDILDDVLSDLIRQHPEQETYKKLLDYIWSSVQDVSEKLKTI